MKQFLKLMHKDWRLNRAVVVGLLIMNVMAYALGGASYLWDKFTFVPTASSHRLGHGGVPLYAQFEAPLGQYMRTAAVFGLIVMVLAAAAFGGAAYALERRERSADFLAMLPVKRSRIIASKLIVALAVLGAVLAIEVGILLLSDFQRQFETMPEFFLAIFNFLAITILLFGIAWLFSTVLSSAAIAASVAIGAGCVSLVISLVWRAPVNGNVAPEIAISAACGAGIVFVLIGNMYYLRRVAP